MGEGNGDVAGGWSEAGHAVLDLIGGSSWARIEMREDINRLKGIKLRGEIYRLMGN